MKVWLKVLIGILLGILLGVLLPIHSQAQNVFEYLSKLFIQIGRFMVFPLVFFSVLMGTYELKRDGKMFSVYWKIFVFLIASTIVLVIVGILTVLVFSPERVPIIAEEEKAIRLYSVGEVFLHIFPKNMFKIFVEPGNFILPLVALAFFLGVNLDFDKQLTRPAIQVFDSISRIFYHANSLIVELFGIAVIVIVTYRTMYIRSINMDIFKQLIIIIGFDLIIVIFGIFPGVLHLLGDKINPYRWLYATTASALTALVTGDEYVSLGMLVKHGKESMKLKREVSQAVYSVFIIFGRAGTAMVTSIAFILILRSYSSLELTFMQILWVGVFSVVTSFFLINVPGLGVYVSLSLLSGYYGRGIENGYLILKPVMPLLVSAGVLVDIVTASLVAYLIGKMEKLAEGYEIDYFI